MPAVRSLRHVKLRLSPLDVSARKLPLPLPLQPKVTNNIAAVDLEKILVLGNGNGGTVYKVKHKMTSQVYALKVIHADNNCNVRGEIEIHRRVSTPHVVQFHEAYEGPTGDISILMEYMESGSLDTVSKKNSSFFTQESNISKIANQMLKGLSYLHSNKIIHRDIKPSNFLVNDKMEIKIADFGVSKVALDKSTNSYVGTCAYMSPERFDTTSENYVDDYSGDIWSLGLTLLELYLGRYPLLSEGQKPDWATLMWAICFEDLPMLPENVSDEFQSFVQCCLEKDPSKRWSASKLLSHPFVCKD